MYIKRLNRTFDFPDTYTWMMGILNVTPDSFSDGGNYTNENAILKQAQHMIDEGVNIIDIGGESTRPGHVPTTLEEELNRVIPAVKAIREVFPQVLISIDTWKAEVAKQALIAGADMINDQWRATREPDIAAVCADYNAPLILMHNRETYQPYGDLIAEINTDMRESIQICLDKGMSREQLIVDPGVGFAKTSDDNLSTIRDLKGMRELGLPILLATSRKGFLKALIGKEASERDYATAVTTTSGILAGACDMVRVHNVEINKEAAIVADAIVRGSVELYD